MDHDLNIEPEFQKLERLADPEYKEEYEMPEWYQERLRQFVELLESRDKYKKILPTLPPADYALAMPAFEELDEAVESLEQQLADEYENYQEEQRREQEVHELMWLQEELTEEMYIWVKHKKPYIFEEFKRYATDGMTEAELAEHERIVALREASELDQILAAKPAPKEFENLFVKHLLPDEWMPEQLLHIIYQGWRTDNFFQYSLEIWERGIDTKRGYIFDLPRALPVRRRNMEEAAVEIKQRIDAGARFLLDYAEKCRKNGKFTLLETPDVGRLEELFERLENNRARKYVIIKHTMPAEQLEEYARLVTLDFSPEETAEFFRQVAESEEKDLRPLLRSIDKDRRVDEMLTERRAAGLPKIDGPQLTVSRSRDREYLKDLVPKPDARLGYDLAQRYERNLRAYYAVTGAGRPAERFLDEIAEALDAMRAITDEIFITLKLEKSPKFGEFEKIVTEKMQPAELEEFYERIARLEAEKLNQWEQTDAVR